MSSHMPFLQRLDRTLASLDRLRVDILPSDTTPFVNSLNKVSARPGARCASPKESSVVDVALARAVRTAMACPRTSG